METKKIRFETEEWNVEYAWLPEGEAERQTKKLAQDLYTLGGSRWKNYLWFGLDIGKKFREEKKELEEMKELW